jgi:GNAT superfamily N-acetyltransferase
MNDADEIVRRIETNQIDRSVAFCYGLNGWIEQEGPVLWSASGIVGPYSNRVSLATIAGDERERMADIVAQYQNRKTSFWWIVGPSTRPVDLSRHLADAGFKQIYDGPGMALDLAQLPAAPETRTDVSIRHLSHAEALADWNNIDFQRPKSTDYDHIREAHALIPDSYRLDWFVAIRDERPICRCLTFVGRERDVVGLYWLATDPGARNIGIGSAVSIYALNHARQNGCHLAVLSATDLAVPLYRRLGFSEYCRFQIHEWSFRNAT